MASNLLPEALRRTRKQLRETFPLISAAIGAPEAALTVGTALPAMAGTGLGVGSGMLAQALRGERPAADAATETTEEGIGRFTYQPRLLESQRLLEQLGDLTEPVDRGMRAVGGGAGKVAGFLGAPEGMQHAISAGVYGGLNLLDPEHLAPGLAAVKALRGAGALSRSARTAPVPSRFGQSGAWSHGDLADTPGDFGFRSPTLEAFTRLKPAEQSRLSGPQLRKALVREGAKKEELTEMGLDDVLASVEPVNVAEVRQLAEGNQPDIRFNTNRTSGATLDDDAIEEAAREAAYEDPDLTYPHTVYRGTGRHREEIDTYDSEDAADRAVEEMKASDIESETEYYRDNIKDYLSEEEIAAMDESEIDAWAEERATSLVEENNEYNVGVDTDADPVNLDSLLEWHSNRIRENPEEYGLAGQVNAPKYGEYTLEGDSSNPSYSVSVGRLEDSARFGFGKGGREAVYQLPEESAVRRIELLRRSRRDADPELARYARESNYGHFDYGRNQMFHTRETDMAAPEWGSVQEGVGPLPEASQLRDYNRNPIEAPDVAQPLRSVEEGQSDWYQAGRKAGWATPEDFAKKNIGTQESEMVRIQALRESALSEVPTLMGMQPVAPMVEALRRNAAMDPEALTVTEQRVMQSLQEFERVAASEEPADFGTRLAAASNLVTALRRLAPLESPAHAILSQAENQLEQLPHISSSPYGKAIRSGPMRETKQYTALLMADALRRAVLEGQQYISYTPGDVHTKRYGTQSMYLAPSADNPREFLYEARPFKPGTGPDAPSSMEQMQAHADRLLHPEAQADLSRNKLSLDDPELDKRLTSIVEASLGYGGHDYADPAAFYKSRAAAVRKLMESAAAGPRAAHVYAPRAKGNDDAYDIVPKLLSEMLRRSGAPKLEFKPYGRKFDEGEPQAAELMPEHARAVKRGLMLPY